MKKVPITIVNVAKDLSRIASLNFALKVTDWIKQAKNVPTLFLQCIYIWSDVCSAQFHSCFTFVLLTHLNPNKANHGKRPMDGIGRTIKNKVLQEVQPGRISSDSLKDFAIYASRLNQSMTMLYLPKKDIFKKPASKENTSYTRVPLDVHKGKRKRNNQGMNFLECYRLSFNEALFFTYFCRKSSYLIVCAHKSFESVPNRRPHCLNNYYFSKEWMECPVCKKWHYSEDCFSA